MYPVKVKIGLHLLITMKNLILSEIMLHLY